MASPFARGGAFKTGEFVLLTLACNAPGPRAGRHAAAQRPVIVARLNPPTGSVLAEGIVGVDPRVGRQRVGGTQRLVPGALLRSVGQVVVVRAGVTALLDPAGAADALGLVAAQRPRRVLPSAREAARQHRRVLEGLRRSLPEKREHRVGGR